MKYKNNKFKYLKNKSTDSNQKMSDDDLLALNLLYLQLVLNIIMIYSYYLICISTIEAIEILYSKYDDRPTEGYEPDGIALEALYMKFGAQILFTQIAVQRYNMLYRQKQEGKISFSLIPNMGLIQANLISIVSMMISISSSEEIYERNKSQTIFGV